MQDPMTGELVPIPEDKIENAKPGWKVYTVGERVRFKGWYWEITDCSQGQLRVRPVEKVFRHTSKRRRKKDWK